MNWLKRVKEEGLSLRLTFMFMLIVSLGVTTILLFTNYRTIKTFHALSDAMDTYIDLQAAADSLLKASDYLTEQAQCYTVIGDRSHLDAYFDETEHQRLREKAIEPEEPLRPLARLFFHLLRPVDLHSP